MSRLMVKCSECKAIVDTGVSMDFVSFCEAKLEAKTLPCYNCKTQIVWNKDDVLATSFC
jgi:endogenous inhibitor of DNA gyrase (YacG/DUF329 family)